MPNLAGSSRRSYERIVIFVQTEDPGIHHVLTIYDCRRLERLNTLSNYSSLSPFSATSYKNPLYPIFRSLRLRTEHRLTWLECKQFPALAL